METDSLKYFLQIDVRETDSPINEVMDEWSTDIIGQVSTILGLEVVRECQGAVAPAPDGTQLGLLTYTLI